MEYKTKCKICGCLLGGMVVCLSCKNWIDKESNKEESE